MIQLLEGSKEILVTIKKVRKIFQAGDTELAKSTINRLQHSFLTVLQPLQRRICPRLNCRHEAHAGWGAETCAKDYPLRRNTFGSH